MTWCEASNDQRRALHEAVLRDERAPVEALLQVPIDPDVRIDVDDIDVDDTALILATRNNSIQVAGLLLEAGAQKNLRCEDGRTALMVAVKLGRLEIARLLVAAGADVDLQDEGGFTALMLTAVYGLPKIAKLLLDAGARKNLRDNRGSTALILTQDIAGMEAEVRVDLVGHFLRTEAGRLKVNRMLS